MASIMQTSYTADISERNFFCIRTEVPIDRTFKRQNLKMSIYVMLPTKRPNILTCLRNKVAVRNEQETTQLY